jgi:hypothetical protein
MAFVIPFRVVTAAVGLLVGYYAGIIVEYRWRINGNMLQLAQTVSQIHYYGSKLAEYYSSEDESDYDVDFTASHCFNDSDEDTEFSEGE